jgi:hypothetical protein
LLPDAALDWRSTGAFSSCASSSLSLWRLPTGRESFFASLRLAEHVDAAQRLVGCEQTAPLCSNTQQHASCISLNSGLRRHQPAPREHARGARCRA